METERTLIIGAGPAGLTAAIASARRGRETILLEKNSRPGRKLYISGKGRCNLTNNCSVQTVIDNTPTNGRFLYSALTAFPPQALMEMMEQGGLPLKTERGNRVFPVSDKAGDVVDTFVRLAKEAGAQFRQGEAEALLLSDGRVQGVRLKNGQELLCSRLIIATGGVSYPLTGSTGDGYRFAAQAGHTIVPPRPSLVPLLTEEHSGYDADGLLLKNIAIRLKDGKKKKTIYEDFGELELRRWGLSGAVVRSASAHIRQMEAGRYRLELDLKPALTEEVLDSRLQRELAVSPGQPCRVIFKTLVPQALVEDIAKRAGAVSEVPCAQVKREQRRELSRLLKSMDFHITGFRPLEEAIVTSGGVSVKEISPSTMESKLVRGLFFAGEVIDYDCYTGGFNIQSAASTGCLAAGQRDAAPISGGQRRRWTP